MEREFILLENEIRRKTFYINFVEDLRQYFEKKFADMHSKKQDFKLFFHPFDVEPESANEDFFNGIK